MPYMDPMGYDLNATMYKTQVAVLLTLILSKPANECGLLPATPAMPWLMRWF